MNYPSQSVEANHGGHGAADPYLGYGEFIDLHPVHAAIALAREVAEPSGTAPTDISWDPAWAELAVDDDEYYNDLIERNWGALSRWYSIMLAAGKILHIKVRDGVETVTVITPMPEIGMPIVEYAVWYANHGLPVFPCDPTDKSPLVSAGFKAATTDENQIRVWWRRWPNAMIGVPMGAASEVWAVDPDASKNGAPNGVANWAKLIAKYGGIPDTHTHNTPNGGQHVLFKWHDDRHVTNREGGLSGLGINVRGEGGYIIAWPSVSADGRSYEIASSLHFFNFAEAPSWLYDKILPMPPAVSQAQSIPSISQQAVVSVRPPAGAHLAYADAALSGEYDAVVSASPGGRNNQLNASTFKLATLVGAGVLEEREVETTMMQAALACGLVAEDGRDKCFATMTLSALKQSHASGKRARWATKRLWRSSSCTQP